MPQVAGKKSKVIEIVELPSGIHKTKEERAAKALLTSLIRIDQIKTV